MRTPAPHGASWCGQSRSISDKDPAVDVNLEIVMPQAPRRVWVGVRGQDDDVTIVGIINPGLDLVGYDFAVPSTTGGSNESHDYTQVTDVFDIADITQLTTFPIELATGDFALAFTVFARIRVDGFVPAAMIIRELSRRLPKPWVDLYELGKTNMMVGPGGNHAHMVGLGAEGAIYHKQLTPERPTIRDEGWRRLSGPVKMPVKAIAGETEGFGCLPLMTKAACCFKSPAGLAARPHGGS